MGETPLEYFAIVYTYLTMKNVETNKFCIGIASEYNPFHNGHALHIERARTHFGSGGAKIPVVAVLSSSFTQRGLPALADKWTRACMALANGIDLVLELPFAYACNAGPEFARGAVDVLAATKFVTHLSFGMECLPEPQKTSFDIETILDILIQEPPSFKSSLKKSLALGQAYPKALASALEDELPNAGTWISSPNNMLALCYLLRLRIKKYDLIPLPIQREGSGYHDITDEPLASATAIRSTFFKEGRWIEKAMPASSISLLKEEQKRGRLCTGTEMLWSLLRSVLLRSTPEDLRKYAGMDEGIENLFLKHYSAAMSYEDFIGRCVCARYTRSRLQRQAAHLLVGLDRWTALALKRNSPPYIRVLGCNERGRSLLRKRQINTGDLPIITRLPAASGVVAQTAAELEFRASHLRELLLPCPDFEYEKKQKPSGL